MSDSVKTSFGEKTRSPGVYRFVGKRGIVKYRLLVNVKKPDPQSMSGWKWGLKGKTFETELGALTAKLKIQAAVRSGKYAELTALDGAVPAVTLSLSKLFGPCVYMLKQAGSEEILYVGMSANGIMRLGD